MSECGSYRNSSFDLHGRNIAAAMSAEAKDPAAQLETYVDSMSPVPTPMTPYAIRRLARTPDPEQMSNQARTAREHYVERAQKNLPPPQVFDGTAWNADYDESDAFRKITDLEGRVLAGQPVIKLVKYPFEFKDRTSLESTGVHPRCALPTGRRNR